MVDFESGNVEEILELAFIACQSTVTRVVSRCGAFHKSNGFQSKKKGGKVNLMERCDEKVRGTPYTRITTIDAFANYAKHQDEWGDNWDKLNRKSRPTAEMVKKIGATRGGTGNMRRAFNRIVGHGHFERVGELSDIIRAWGKRLAIDYERELKAQRLLPERASAKR